MRFDVAMANTNRVDVSKRAEKLIHVELDLEHGHGLFKLRIVATGAVDSLGNVFKYKIEIHFILLQIKV